MRAVVPIFYRGEAFGGCVSRDGRIPSSGADLLLSFTVMDLGGSRMDWREMFLGVLVLAFLILVPPILFGWIFLWAWTLWRPKSKARPVFVYAASFAVWLVVVMPLWFDILSDRFRCH